MNLPVLPPVAPMLAKPVPSIPPGRFYEPKWDGFRAIVFRDGDDVEIGSRNERPMTRYFPEVAAALRANVPARCVLDGEIVIAGDGRLDFWALQQRLHPAASRVELLAGQTPASFIAFDLLALGDDDFTGRPFRDRRAALESALADAAPPIHLTPITTDEALAARWFETFEGAGLDGLIAKDGDTTYQPNKRVMAKVKHVRTADCVLAGYRPHKAIPDAVGSLLLGLYDDGSTPASQWSDMFGGLMSVGVVGAFPAARRRELFAELQPLVIDLADHPWGRLAGLASERRGAGSRWNPGKDLSFVALRPERVLEVRYDHMEGARFRHPPQFVRWRPDRDPRSCGYGQLERPVRYDLADILGGEGLNARAYDPGVAAAPEIHRWSPDDYHRLVDSGALEDLRVELIDGFIVDMSARSPAHDYAIQWLDHALQRALDDGRFWVRANMALSLGASEPEPDIAVVAVDADAPYHPATAALAIEVSHSSLRNDLQVKPRVYAAAGVARYWVIDLDHRRAVAHAQPGADRYERVETVGQDATLAAPELGISIALAELLAFAIR